MKNKYIIFGIVIGIIVILIGIVLGGFIINKNVNITPQEISPNQISENSNEYIINNNFKIKEETDFTNGKLTLYANDKKIFEKDETLESIEKLIKLNDKEYVIIFANNGEGLISGIYLFYDKGEKYINLSTITQLETAVDVNIENDTFKIESKENYFMPEQLCLNYHDDEIVNVIEEFQYKGNGKFVKTQLVEEYKVKDILKLISNVSSCSELEY